MTQGRIQELYTQFSLPPPSYRSSPGGAFNDFEWRLQRRRLQSMRIAGVFRMVSIQRFVVFDPHSMMIPTSTQCDIKAALFNAWKYFTLHLNLNSYGQIWAHIDIVNLFIDPDIWPSLMIEWLGEAWHFQFNSPFLCLYYLLENSKGPIQSSKTVQKYRIYISVYRPGQVGDSRSTFQIPPPLIRH
jgi:hypothetical protein